MPKPTLMSTDRNLLKINPQLPVVLLVDDTLSNLRLLEDIFEDGYNLPTAQNGEEAWALLTAYDELFDAVLLDRMMPGIMGEEVLDRMQNHELLRHVSVIFQTAKASLADFKEGIRLGADYYVTKPYDEDQLEIIVKTAVGKSAVRKQIYKEVQKIKKSLSIFSTVKEGVLLFEIRTMAEVQQLSLLLSQACPDPGQATIGLQELGYNAVEHGLAGITYQEKSKLLVADQLLEEIERRINLPENQGKHITIRISMNPKAEGKEIHFVIKDPGEGFDHKKYMQIDSDRILDAHGRGIAVGAVNAFDELIYNEKGNEVTAVVKLARS